MELVLPIYNAHPYFSLKNFCKIVHIMHSKIQYVEIMPANSELLL